MNCCINLGLFYSPSRPFASQRHQNLQLEGCTKMVPDMSESNSLTNFESDHIACLGRGHRCVAIVGLGISAIHRPYGHWLTSCDELLAREVRNAVPEDINTLHIVVCHSVAARVNTSGSLWHHVGFILQGVRNAISVPVDTSHQKISIAIIVCVEGHCGHRLR